MIRLQGVSKSYQTHGEPAVQEVDLEIQRGETCVLVGPSGCGKTTLLRMINRLVEPSAGEIYIDGRNIHDLDPDQLRRGIGYVIQEVGLLPHRTVYDNVGLVPRLLGWSARALRERVYELLELVGLEPTEVKNRFPHQLSGGQVQRVGVARAMAADPPILLMDEPFGAVDPIIRERLQDEFLRLQAEMRKTICFVTHDVDEAFKMGDSIAVMDRGVVLQHAPPLELLARPSHSLVDDLMGRDRELRILGLVTAGEAAEMYGNGHGPGATVPPTVKVEAGVSLRLALETMLQRDADGVWVQPLSGDPALLRWEAVRAYLRDLQRDEHGT